MSSYLCFDLGTTKIKSSLLNESGQIIYFSSIDAKTYYDNGIYQKPEEYFNTVINEVSIIKKKHPEEFKKTVAFICSGQLGGICGIDKNWNVVFPWTHSMDSRFSIYVDRIEKEIGQLVRMKSGGYPFCAGKILWIKKDFPEIYKKIAKFISLTTYVSGRICNLNIEYAFTDYSYLPFWGLADVIKSRWDSEICRNSGIDIGKLPNILKPFEIIETIPKRTFGTDEDIKVLAGCGDQVAGFLGSGIFNKNDIVDVTGTYTVLGYCSNEFKIDLKHRVFSSIYSGIKDIFYQIAVIAAGGYTYKWFIEKFNYKPALFFEDYKSSKGLYFIPYIGGRYHPVQPYYDGSWIGISWEHTLDDFYASLLESFGYEFNFYLEPLRQLNNLTGSDLKEIKVIGGGSEDNFWSNIKTNILNLKYLKLNKLPFEIMGLFLIAKYKDRIKDGYKKLLANKIIYTEKIIFPNQRIVNSYIKSKENYIKIINDLGKIYFKIKNN
ncbi:MAG: FGGY family carbohydrate kinase [Actinobacteria bacterium]|nr:FGGY family carbohydrate kinase [Actinomycetota bacterium]